MKTGQFGRPALVVAFILLLGSCSEVDLPAFQSISVAPGGRIVAYLERRQKVNTIHVHSDMGKSHMSRAFQLRQPVEITLSFDSERLLFVTRESGSSGHESSEWILWRQGISSNDEPMALTSSSTFLASPRETPEGDYVFLLGSKALGDNRVSAQWAVTRIGKANEILSTKAYGYRMNPTVLSGFGIAFLNSDGIGSASSTVVEFVSFDGTRMRPRLPGEDVGKRTVDFGCDSRGTVCYRVESTDVPGRSFYHHRLVLFWEDKKCDVGITHHWIDTVALSPDGDSIALIGTTFDDRRRVIDRNLAVFRVSHADCASISFIHKL